MGLPLLCEVEILGSILVSGKEEFWLSAEDLRDMYSCLISVVP